MKHLKKVLALILASVILVSAMPAQTFAAVSRKLGSERRNAPTEFFPGEHEWTTEKGHVVYAPTAVVISEDESAVIACTKENGLVRMSPVPAEILSMSDAERNAVTAIVFAAGDVTEHVIYRTKTGTLKVSEAEDCLLVQPEGPAESGLTLGAPDNASKRSGVYDTLEFNMPVSVASRSVYIDRDGVKGTVEVTANGTALYNFNLLPLYWYENFSYELDYRIEYDLQIEKTTDFKPSDLNDPSLYEEMGKSSVRLLSDEQFDVTMDFADYMFAYLHLDVPNYLNVVAAANNDLNIHGVLNTKFSFGSYADSFFIRSSGVDMETTSEIIDIETEVPETVFLIADTVSADAANDTVKFELGTESGAFLSFFRNDAEFSDAEDESGKRIKDGEIHYCGTAAMPNNYCITCNEKTFYRYSIDTRMGLLISAAKQKDTLSDKKMTYHYISKAYDENITKTSKTGEIDRCPHYGYLIDVTVFDRSGKPAEGATVTAAGNEVLPREERFRTAVTDGNGHAVIYVPNGFWTVQAKTADGSPIGAAQAEIKDHPTSVVINDSITYIDLARLVLDIPTQTGQPLSDPYSVSAMAMSPSRFRLDYSATPWKTFAGETIATDPATGSQLAIEGAQFALFTLSAQSNWTYGRLAFSDDLVVYAENGENDPEAKCCPVYTKVSEDGSTAWVMMRIDTFRPGTLHHHVTVEDGFGSGEYRVGDPVLVAAFDVSEYGEDLSTVLAEASAQMILDSAPEDWTGKFGFWRVYTDGMSYPESFTPLQEGKYSLSTFVMPDKDVNLGAYYLPQVDEVEISLPVPAKTRTALPMLRDGLSLWSPDGRLAGSKASWIGPEGGTITVSAEGDQYLVLELSAFDYPTGVPLLFADEVAISLVDTGSGGNEKYRLVGYTVSEDKMTLTAVILVHIARPGATEYFLTVKDGFLSGWYEEGVLVPVVSYDVPFLKDKIEDYLGKWATVLKILLPPSWQLSFDSWKVEAPTDGSVKYKDSFIPIVTKEGTSYAAAFFRMPGCDAVLNAEYGGLTEIKEIVMDFDLPEPGSYLDYIAKSDSEGVKSAVPYMNYLGWFPMMWDTIFRAKYNERYTAFIPVSPKDGYAFGWPLGLTTKAYVPAPAGSGRTEADFFLAAGEYAMIVHTYRTPKAQLLQVVDPNPIYFENGTSADVINAYLESVKAGIVSEAGSGKARVKWNTVADLAADESGRFTYDSSLATRQEVLDGNDMTYTLKGTVILPSDVRNEEADGHAIVDQTVEIKVIIKAKDGTELYPPIADPDSCESAETLKVALKNAPENPSGAEIHFNNILSEPEKYTEPFILEQRDRDVTYVIEAWTEYEGKTSPTARFVYTVLAPEQYHLKVNGGVIVDEAGRSLTDAVLPAGATVTVKADAARSYESFDHWKFEGMTAAADTEEYTFTMPAADVVATAVFLPDEQSLLIDKVVLKLAEPAAGETLASAVSSAEFSAIQSALYITSEPLPGVVWNTDGYPTAEAGGTYTASIPLRIDQLRCGIFALDEAYFSPALEVTVNGKKATVLIDQSRKFATALVTYEIPQASFSVSYDANGGDVASVPQPQTKLPGTALVLSEKVPTREGANFLGWSSQKDGGVEYAPGDPYENDSDIVLYAVWEEQNIIRKLKVSFDVPAEAGESLPEAAGIGLGVLDPSGAPVRLAEAGWVDDFGLAMYVSETGDQYLVLTAREDNPAFVFASDLAVSLQDTSDGGNGKVKVTGVAVSEDGKEAKITVLVHIAKPGAKEYYVTVNGGIGDGYYEEGDTVLVFSYDIKSISTVLKEILPEYKTLISLAEYFAEKLTGSFEKWKVLDPTDGTLEYKTDFWPVVLKSGKMPKTTYAAAFFTMPAHDVELEAVYGSPKTIDSVTVDFAVPRIGQRLAELAAVIDPKEGVKPVALTGKDGKYKIFWSGSDTVGYNKEYTARIFVTADSGYQLKEILNIVTLDAYFPKAYDFDNGTAQSGYTEGTTIGYMDYAVLTYTYKTPKAQLLSIEEPNTLYFANGTSPEEINRVLTGLELTVMTEDGLRKAKANWGRAVDTSEGKTGRYTYDRLLADRQEIYDNERGTYTVGGVLILPSDIRNTATKMHEKVDQTVEIKVVILERDSTELLPPTADPDSCESETALAVELLGDERNPVGTEIRYILSTDGVKGEESVYGDKIALAQRSEDTLYVIEAWAQNGEAVSEKAAFTYLVKAEQQPVYTVRVIGGHIEYDGETPAEARFAAGSQVTVAADPDERCERFGSWKFEGLSESSDRVSYTFVMPQNDVTATAFFLPLEGEGPVIQTADITLDEPAAGVKLAETVQKSTYTDDLSRALTSQPELSVNWNTGDHAEALAGRKYTASMLVSVGDLRVNGEELPAEAIFSSALTAKVNGRSARVTVDESRKYAIVEIDFELPQEFFTVTYDGNGEGVSGVPASQQKAAGAALTLSSLVPAREHFVFMGWALEADSDSVSYDPGDLYEQDADVTLYAVWRDLYSVEASCSAGGTVTPELQEVPAGGDAVITVAPKVTEGEVWMIDCVTLWDSASADGRDITAAVKDGVLTLENVSENLKVFVSFKQAPYTVIAEVKAGKGEVAPEISGVDAGGSVTLRLVPETGYEIGKVILRTVGNTKAAVPDETDVTDLVSEGELTVRDIRSDLYADVYFKEMQYAVRYDANGGTGAPAEQTKMHFADLTLSAEVPTRDGYRFLGWSLGADAAVAEYAPGSLYQENADTTLYAVWGRLLRVTATCTAGGSVDPVSQEVLSGESAFIAVRPDERWTLGKVTAWYGTDETPHDITGLVSEGKLSIGCVAEDIRIEVVFNVPTEPDLPDAGSRVLMPSVGLLLLGTVLLLAAVLEKKRRARV